MFLFSDEGNILYHNNNKNIKYYSDLFFPLNIEYRSALQRILCVVVHGPSSCLLFIHLHTTAHTYAYLHTIILQFTIHNILVL